MTFWLLVLAGAAGAVLAYKKSNFYKMWAILFNIFIAVYLSVMISPLIVKMIPEDISGLEYQKAACILGVAVIVFGILQAIAVNLITGVCDVTFPKLVDTIGIPALGFFSGWFVCAFLLFLVTIMPVSQKGFLQETFPSDGVAVSSVAGLCSVTSNVSLQRYNYKHRQIIQSLVNPAAEQDIENEGEAGYKETILTHSSEIEGVGSADQPDDSGD